MTFSQNWEIDYCLSSLLPRLMTRKVFLVQLVEHWKMPSWERNISEHDIIQHTQEMRNVFWGLGYGIEINRH